LDYFCLSTKVIAIYQKISILGKGKEQKQDIYHSSYRIITDDDLHYFEKLNELLDHKQMVQNDFHHIIFSHFHDEYYQRYVYNRWIMFHVVNYMLNIQVVDGYVRHQHDHPKMR
jgi:hypothetical protein